jgi:hypothetical protein
MTQSSNPNSRYQHTQVTLRLPAHILRRVDEVAAEQMTNRASVLRQYLALGAGCKPKPSTVTPESAEPNI